MTRPILFISDLHLDGARPDITDQFLTFLSTDARKAQSLYILGDLFETWIGDDDPDADKRRIQAALRELTTSGVPCFVMHGNRDFLIGKRFCKTTGCRLLQDGTLVDVFGRRVLLMHGDTLCTDDHSYQRLRRRIRNPVVQFVLRNLPLSTRNWLAAKLRAGSKAHIDKTLAMQSVAMIMDVNADAVTQAFVTHGVDIMIHGHTHRPAIHSLLINGQPATRIVLGDWYTQGSVLRWDETGYQLLSMSRSATNSAH
jgi:UDP-2,3-diacylglucosamine hydrolase